MKGPKTAQIISKKNEVIPLSNVQDYSYSYSNYDNMVLLEDRPTEQNRELAISPTQIHPGDF